MCSQLNVTSDTQMYKTHKSNDVFVQDVTQKLYKLQIICTSMNREETK